MYTAQSIMYCCSFFICMQVLSLEFEDDDEMVLLDETVSLLHFGNTFPNKTIGTF